MAFYIVKCFMTQTATTTPGIIAEHVLPQATTCCSDTSKLSAIKFSIRMLKCRACRKCPTATAGVFDLLQESGCFYSNCRKHTESPELIVYHCQKSVKKHLYVSSFNLPIISFCFQCFPGFVFNQLHVLNLAFALPPNNTFGSLFKTSLGAISNVGFLILLKSLLAFSIFRPPFAVSFSRFFAISSLVFTLKTPLLSFFSGSSCCENPFRQKKRNCK